MSETPLVHLDNIVLRFGEKTVLDGIDLKVFGKDRLVILGQSGGGKSTMLRLILGILKPTSGIVRYRHRSSRKEIERLIEQNLAIVGMSGTEENMPAELSGGMRKRVSLARALMMEPELILFDEPSAGLDPVISSVIDELIISLTEKTNTTSVIVTHKMESAFRIATRMAMLYQGKIIEEGPPDRFRASDNPVVHQFVTGTTEGPIMETPAHADSAR